MRKALILLLAATLAGCSSGTTPPNASTTKTPAPAATTVPAATAAPAAPASGGNVQKKLQESAGNGATNCGDVQTLSGAELQAAGDCAMKSAKDKKPFLVSYTMPGMAVGVAGNAEGKLVTVQSAEENGKPGEPKVAACPAELRVAQSGRVTCMPAGSMGVMPGAGNPHAGQGASPHGGGMSTPPAGTPNPHETTTAPKKSH